jgi:hypothetical protein
MEVMTATESIASSHIQLADKLSTTVSAELREKARRKGVILSRVSLLPFPDRMSLQADGSSYLFSF